MWRQPFATVGGFGLGLILWVLQMLDVILPLWLLIPIGSIALGMVVFGSIPLAVSVYHVIQRVKLRTPFVIVHPGVTKVPQEQLTQQMIVKEYSPQVRDKLDALIQRGEDLCDKMKEKDFSKWHLEPVIREWLNNVNHDVWEVIPEHASYIVGEQGDLTEDEKLLYQGWTWDAASLRISVDRRLARLREIRSQIQSADLEAGCKETLEHAVIEQRSHADLTILRGYAGWPVNYPIRIRNCRPHPVDIIGYDITIFWDGRPVQKVNWQAPSREASNGITICPPFDSQEPLNAITIPPDHDFQLNVPVNVGQIANQPAESPVWTAKGNITFHCANETKIKAFDFNTDNYKLSHEDWVELGQSIRGSFPD